MFCSVPRVVSHECTNGARFPIVSLLAEPPPVVQVAGNVSAVPGAVAVLRCLVLSAGPFNLTWQRHGRDALLLDPRRLRVLPDLGLELRALRPSDTGTYSCTAANQGGAATASVFLTVQGNHGMSGERAARSLGQALP